MNFLEEKLLTPEDLATYLGISIYSIYARTSKRNQGHTKIEIPPWFYIGNRIRWRREDVENWLRERKLYDGTGALEQVRKPAGDILEDFRDAPGHQQSGRAEGLPGLAGKKPKANQKDRPAQKGKP